MTKELHCTSGIIIKRSLNELKLLNVISVKEELIHCRLHTVGEPFSMGVLSNCMQPNGLHRAVPADDDPPSAQAACRQRVELLTV